MILLLLFIASVLLLLSAFPDWPLVVALLIPLGLLSLGGLIKWRVRRWQASRPPKP